MSYSPFSTEDAIDEGYENLEKRCYAEDIDHDNALSKTIVFRTWEKQGMSWVKSKSASNLTQVGYSAYFEGVSIIGDIIGREEIKSFEDLIEARLSMMGNYHHTEMDLYELSDMMEIETVSDPMKGTQACTEHIRVKFKDSAYSQIEDTYATDAEFGPWIHRAIVVIGLLNSDTIPDKFRSEAENVRDEFVNAYGEARSRYEEVFYQYIGKNYQFWVENGIHSDAYHMLVDAVNSMKGDMREPCECLMEGIKEDAERLESYGIKSDE